MCVCECVPQANCAELVVYVADMVQSKCHHKRKKNDDNKIPSYQTEGHYNNTLITPTQTVSLCKLVKRVIKT